MGLLNLVALGVGLFVLTVVFICVIAIRRRIRRRREAKQLREQEEANPWAPDYSKAAVAALPPAVMGGAQYQYPPQYHQQYQTDVEQGHTWKH
jgi:flagellar biosynthesis/type III secretory pathway M-ring protein FliF/YscJ